MSQEVEQPAWGWLETPLQSLDPHGTAMFTLSWSFSGDQWLLAQGGRLVSVIKRGNGGTRLRTASERWHMGVTGRKPFGRQLVFGREGEREAALSYSPSTLRQGGRLDVFGGRRYALRSPLLRTEWRLVAKARGEVARIAFRGHDPVPPYKKHVRLTTEAAEEPLPLAVIMAAGVAILVHYELPRGFGGSNI